METIERVVTKRPRARSTKRNWISTLIVPVVVALITSLIVGGISWLRKDGASDARMEALEKKVDYILDRVDKLADKVLAPAK